MNRLASTPGTSFIRATRSESGQSNRADTPPAVMSDPEEDRAWSLFDAAKSSVERAAKRARRTSSREDTPSSTSRNGTPRTPVRSPPTQVRRLKRPRTRRPSPPVSEANDITTPITIPPPRNTPVQTESDRESVNTDSKGIFLQGLLSNINRPKSPQTPLDLSLTPAARSCLFGPSPPHSPSLSASPQSPIPTRLPLLDSFSPIPDPVPLSPDSLLPRHRSTSPSFAVKSHIQQLVSQALKPHYRAGRLTRDQFTDINKTICRRLYDIAQRGDEVDDMVTGEVDLELASLTV